MLRHFDSKSGTVLRNAAIACCLAVFQLQTSVASAGVIVPIPGGLNEGDHFRIIFVTSGTIDGTSSNIADYNAFVNSQAQGATFEGHLIHWSAIGSTDAVDALHNTNTFASSAVYMVDGTKVSSAYTDATRSDPGGLWSSALLAQPTEGIDGTQYPNPSSPNAFVWTGTAGNGTEYSTAIFGSYGLGTLNYGYDPNTGTNIFANPQVQAGSISSTQTGSNWVQIPNVNATNTPGLQARTLTFQMYGISDELVVAPEPSTLLTSGVGIIAVALAARKRRKSKVS